MLKFNIITANEILQTGKISFQFIFDSEMDYDNHSKVDNWGVLLRDLNDNHRVVNVFGDTRLIFGWGNDTIDDKEWMSALLEKLPACTLLIEKEDADIFKEYCDKLGYEYTYTYFDGYLKTA